MNTVAHLEDRFYRGRPDWTNGTQEFHDMLRSAIDRHGRDILEVGPGLTNPTSLLLSEQATRFDGLDIDPRARGNTWLNAVHIYEGREFPIEDAQYDLIVADYVMEHVEDPALMFREVARVLRPGGGFVLRTPNNWHYVAIISRFSPHWVHVKTAHAARNHTDAKADPYPTFYRANTGAAIRRHAEQAGLKTELRMIEKEPSYLRFHPLAYRLGVGYERMVNRWDALSGLRANIFAILTKD